VTGSFSFAGFAQLMLFSMVPFVLAAQGTMLGGRAGVFNVAQEGIMLASASLGFLVAFKTGSVALGFGSAMVLGGLSGLVLSLGSTILGMNQFVIGITLTLAGLGLSTLMPKLAIGVTLTPPLAPTLTNNPIPFLGKMPVLGEVLFRQNVLVTFTVLVSIALWYVLFRTSAGLILRATGENPMAVDALGLDVFRIRHIAVMIGGMLIGLAGAYLPLAYTGTFTEGMVKGRGWLSIALAFFGGFEPGRIFWGGLFFAAVEVLAYRVQIGGSWVPYQFILMLPYLATMGVMALSSRRSRIPGFLGKNYDRERRSTSSQGQG